MFSILGDESVEVKFTEARAVEVGAPEGGHVGEFLGD